MKPSASLRAAVLALTLSAGVAGMSAHAVTVAGVDFPSQATVGGKPLVLNGAGVRYKFIVKVYSAGLYLAGKAATPEEALDSPGPKRLQVVMLREIDADDLGRLFTRGMQENSSRSEFAKSIPGTLRMSEIFARQKKLAPGEGFAVEWMPGAGTMVYVNGQPQGDAIKEPEFFKALMRIWLGPNPADAQLKDALLGKAPRNESGSAN